MSGIVLVVAVGVSVTSFVAFAIQLLVPGSDSTRSEERLNRLADRQRHPFDSEKDDNSFISLLRSEVSDQSGLLEKLTNQLPAVSDYLEQADVRLRPSKFVFLCCICFAAGILIGIFSPAPFILAPLIGIVFAGLPIGWLAIKRKRRLAKFGTQLPSALELLSRSLRAGHSLNAGFGLIASETQA
ncbi:MAG: type II secretion system F family protein, partial [Rubripirellula sp.]